MMLRGTGTRGARLAAWVGSRTASGAASRAAGDDAAGRTEQQPRAWAHRHSIPVGSRVVAIGDVHGDSGAFEALLVAGGVIDQAGGAWAGSNSILVQVGDILDRGVGEVSCLLRLQQLSAEADAAGGKVIGLMGNHELMNYTQDFRFVSVVQPPRSNREPAREH